MKTVAIIQPSLFPWRGYFRIISRSHIFVFFDDVQFDKRGWRNRNQIVSNQGLQWFTVPVITKGKFLQKINQTQISYEDPKWTKKILQTFQSNYGKAKYFSDYFPWLEQKFNSNPQNISDFAIETTKDICHFLKIKTEFIKSSDLNIPDDIERVDRLITICQRVSGTHYLSGPSASEYIGEGLKFKESNLTLEYQTYDLPSYPQPRSPFIGEASILDLLFHCGQDSHLYI